MTTAARLFILSFILCVAGVRPVYAADTCESVFEPPAGERALQLFEQAVRVHSMEPSGQTSEADLAHARSTLSSQLNRESRVLLGSMGVRGGSISVKAGGEFILLGTNGEAKLNQFAKRVHRAYGVRVISYPDLLVRQNGRAGVVEINLGSGLEPVLVIGPPTLSIIANGRDPMRDPELLHELRHLKTLDDLAKRKTNALYGSVQAKTGRIPDKIKISPASYSSYLSFDEVKAYHQQAKQQILNRDFSGALSSITNGFVVANRTRTVARLLARVVGAVSGTAPVGAAEQTPVIRKTNLIYVRRGALTEAHITIQTAEADLVIELPLIDSLSETDSKNTRSLQAQVGRLLRTSTIANDQFVKAGQLLMQGQTEDLQQRLNKSELN